MTDGLAPSRPLTSKQSTVCEALLISLGVKVGFFFSSAKKSLGTHAKELKILREEFSTPAFPGTHFQNWPWDVS